MSKSSSRAIGIQRDALTAKIRRLLGKASAAARKARGELPGFLKNPGKRKKSAKNAQLVA